MIDIHDHILPGIDDGCKTIEDSIKTIIDGVENGVTSIVFTPHYIKGSKFNCNNKDKKKLLNAVKKECKERDIKIDLYFGNEVYVEDDMIDLLKKGEMSTLNGSRYLLFELPMTSEVNNLKDMIFSLRVAGIVPIIAHPERYSYFQKNPEQLIPLIEQGCLFQSNLGSLIGIYGKEACKCVKTLLTHNLVHFMASDVHHSGSKNYLLLKDSFKELEGLVGKEYTDELLDINPLKVINDDIIEIRETKDIKKRFLFF